MSYSVYTPCWACKKVKTCTDAKTLQEGVNAIHAHSYEQGHQGGGSISLMCLRMETTQP